MGRFAIAIAFRCALRAIVSDDDEHDSTPLNGHDAFTRPPIGPDCDVPRDSTTAANVVRQILESAFQVDSSTPLRFVGEGLVP
jgi:hypothetical protein